jgi:hypothetical protein
MTPLARNNLIQYITSFRLMKTGQLHTRWQLAIGFHVHVAAVEDVASSHSLVEIGSSRFSPYCLANRSLRPFRESRAVDCTLVLILVLAANVKEIQLGFSLEFPLDITVRVLNTPWRLLKTRTSCPFEKLESLHVEGCHRVQDILETFYLRSPPYLLQLRHCQVEHVFFTRVEIFNS